MRNRLLRAVVVLLLLAACSSDKPSTAIVKLQGIPTLEGATQPPGTKLRNGFTVAPGTALIADVFPIGLEGTLRGEPIEDRGWRAFLLVTGDPHEVIRHYQVEARRIGLPLAAEYAPEPACGNDTFEGYICNAVGGRRVGSQYRSFWLSMRRQEEPGQAPLSFASLIYSDTEFGVGHPTAREPGLEFGPPAPPLARTWPALPQPKEWIGREMPGGDRLIIEPGSRPAAPVLTNIRATNQTPVILLRIDDDPTTVLARYRRQFVRLIGYDDPNQREIARWTDDGAVVFTLREVEPGGSQYTLKAFQRKGRPTWAYLESGYD